jgi:hypothetical protein
MAYSDPQTVTLSGTAVTLPRTSSGTNAGAFSKDDGTLLLSVSHTYGKRVRRTVRVTSTKISADPLLTNVNQRLSASAYYVVDHPNQGYSITELKDLIIALFAHGTASTNANVLKLLGGEN